MTTTPDARSTALDVVNGRDLSHQNILVTGCNAGIGFETARALAARGAHVLLAARDMRKADETAQRIRAAHPSAQLTPLALDLSSLASVRAAAAEVRVDALHALICNAGLYASEYAETAEGLERTVGVCHFGHFSLTAQLLDKLRAAAPSRVVVVASESHRHPARLDFDRLPLERRQFRSLVAYGQAKLCNVLFANELTRRYARDGVFANSLHPGSMIGTSIFRESLSAKLLALALRPFTKTVEQGAATTVYCATAPELSEQGGRYYADCKEKTSSKESRDPAVGARLWDFSEQLLARLESRPATTT